MQINRLNFRLSLGVAFLYALVFFFATLPAFASENVYSSGGSGSNYVYYNISSTSFTYEAGLTYTFSCPAPVSYHSFQPGVPIGTLTYTGSPYIQGGGSGQGICSAGQYCYLAYLGSDIYSFTPSQSGDLYGTQKPQIRTGDYGDYAGCYGVPSGNDYTVPNGSPLVIVSPGPPPPPAPTITWNVPNASSTASSTPIADFDAWKINASALSTSTTYSAVVEYTGGIINGFISNYDYLTGYQPTGATSTISIAKRTALGSGIDGVNYIWTATTTLYRDDTATSSAVGLIFVVGSPGGATLQPIAGPDVIGGILNDTSTVTTTCDPNSGLIAGSICNLMVILFIPPPSSLAQFNALASSTQNKAPFGYITSFLSAVNGLQGATSATSSYAVLTSSTEASLDVIFGPLKVGLGWLLWLVLAFWSIVRLKIFNP